MTLQEAIKERRSRRNYVSTEIDLASINKLQAVINESHKIGGFRMELVLNDGAAFGKVTKSYGMFKGVNHYIGLITDKTDANSDEKLGYYGELLVLHATVLGLGTCWVGGAFDRKNMPFDTSTNEQIKCAIIVGHAQNSLGFKEKLIRGATHRKTKSATDMYTSDGPVPAWFEQGMQAVVKAPSGLNRQPVTFEYQSGVTRATVKNIHNYLNAFDFGIAKLHFELGAGGGTWEWGNGAAFCVGKDSLKDV